MKPEESHLPHDPVAQKPAVPNVRQNIFGFFQNSAIFSDAVKSAYPLNDLINTAKGIAIGVPLGVAGVPITIAIKKTGHYFSPQSQIFLPHGLHFVPKKVSPLYRLSPIDFLLRNDIVSLKTAALGIGPIGGELLFRGLLMSKMQHELKGLGCEEKCASTVAAISNSLIYALGHPPRVRVNSFVNGLLWSSLTLLNNGNLIPATASHALNNYLAFRQLR